MIGNGLASLANKDLRQRRGKERDAGKREKWLSTT
jgi:hypothetical protein